MTDSHRRRDQWWELVRRYNRLGEMLPRDADDDEVRARVDECKLILAEMKSVRTRMDAILAAENKSRRTSKPA
jgi:hypothetical protein